MSQILLQQLEPLHTSKWGLPICHAANCFPTFRSRPQKLRDFKHVTFVNSCCLLLLAVGEGEKENGGSPKGERHCWELSLGRGVEEAGA